MPITYSNASVTFFPVQAKRSDGKHSCSACKIDYLSQGKNPICPLCEKIHENESLRKQIGELAMDLQMTRDDLRRSETRSDMVSVLREALDLADLEDLATLKVIVYRWRAAQDTFKVTVVHAPSKSKRGERAKLEMRPDPHTREYFEPVSVGGVAFVETFEELIKAQGHVKAMEQYAQAIASRLTS